MKIDYLPRALRALEEAPAEVRKAFFKQVRFLEQNLRHPSLRAKKYDETLDRWQARVNRDWRSYFTNRGRYLCHPRHHPPPEEMNVFPGRAAVVALGGPSHTEVRDCTGGLAFGPPAMR